MPAARSKRGAGAALDAPAAVALPEVDRAVTAAG